MGKSSLVALDSNCLSYLLDALNAGEAPKPDDPLREQKLALVRVMLYDEWGLYVAPRVTEECARIRNTSRAALHASWLGSIFSEVQPIDAVCIAARANELSVQHADIDDCRVLAECEDAGISVLLTYDGELISRLSRQTSVRLLRPVEYWSSLGIAKKASPQTVPHATNPLALARWWRWE